MPTLDTLIARAQAAIDAETDPKKLRPLQANLAAFLATKAEMDDDDDGDEKDKDDDGDESKAKKAAAAAEKAKKSAEAAKHRAKAAEHKAKAAESEEAAKKCEEDEEDEGEDEAAAAPAEHTALLASLAQSVAKIEQAQVSTSRTQLIAGARKLGAITKTEAAWLDAQPLPAVESFLQMRSKAGLVITDEDHLIKPKDAKPGTEASLPAETLEMIEASVSAYPGADKKGFRAKLVEAHLEAHTKQLAAAASGAPGRY